MAAQTLVEEPQVRIVTDSEGTVVTGTIDVTVGITPDGIELQLTGKGAGWSASGTTLVLQPEATQQQPVRYELLTMIQTGGYAFADPAVQVFPLNGNPNMAFGFERSLDTAVSLVFVNSIPAGSLLQPFEALFDIREIKSGLPAAARLDFRVDPTVVFEPPGG